MSRPMTCLRLGAALVGLALPARYTAAQAVPPQPLAKKVRIGDILFDQSSNLAASTRSSIINRVRDQRFDSIEDAAEAVEELTRRAYANEGYASAKVEGWARRVHEDAEFEWCDLWMRVTSEGPRYHLKNVSFSRNTVLSSTELGALANLKADDIFSADAISKGMEAIRQAYLDRGYVNVALFPALEFDDPHQIASVKIDIDEGHTFTFKHALIAGLPPAQAETLIRDFARWKGQLFTPKLLREMTATLQPDFPPCADLVTYSHPEQIPSTHQISLVLNFQACDKQWLDSNNVSPTVNCCPN